MGANLANEVAEGNFCETTIGCTDKKYGKVLRDLFQANHFRVVVVEDADAVEVCGALKNIVACGAGFVDGLKLGDNTKAAVIRLGLMEMIRFVDVFYPGSKLSTFFESCGVADLITTCYGMIIRAKYAGSEFLLMREFLSRWPQSSRLRSFCHIGQNNWGAGEGNAQWPEIAGPAHCRGSQLYVEKQRPGG